MKEYFKYDRGYVNINDQYLFLTNSGNWSEISSLVEKSSKSIRGNGLKAFKYNLFYDCPLVVPMLKKAYI